MNSSPPLDRRLLGKDARERLSRSHIQIIPATIDYDKYNHDKTKNKDNNVTVIERNHCCQGCGRKCSSEDRTVILIFVGVILMSLAYFFLRTHKLEIQPVTYPTWNYKCENSRCVKYLVLNSEATDHENDDNNDGNESEKCQSLITCKMKCGTREESNLLWPRPTGKVNISDTTFNFLPGDVIPHIVVKTNEDDADLYSELQIIFFAKLYQEHPNCESVTCNDPFFHGMSTGHRISIHIDVLNSSKSILNLETDESFELEIIPPGKGTSYELYVVQITANSYFGARHGIETLSQLITYDELTDSLQTYTSAHIFDAPIFPHRGVMIDTARNWLDKSLIKKIIDGLSYNKLNILHWHLTDAESFPFETKNISVIDETSLRLSDLATWGSYSKKKVYSVKDIKDIVHYANVRGVRIVPEIGGPGHIYSGWEMVEHQYPELGKLILCDKSKACTAPPCGQLNIANENSTKIFAALYKELLDEFENIDVMHFGGNGVNIECWKDSEEFQTSFKSQNPTPEDLKELWAKFHKHLIDKSKQFLNDPNFQAIVWQNILSEDKITNHFPVDSFIIQTWKNMQIGQDDSIKQLISHGHKIILSNQDAWDFGCVGGKNEAMISCKETGIKRVYENSPMELYQYSFNADLKKNILGGEALLWGNDIIGREIESRLWPRGMAIAERLWSDPDTKFEDAVDRMMYMREKMVGRGIISGAIIPEWCLQNEGFC